MASQNLCTGCGFDTIYTDRLCGDCRTDNPAIPSNAAPVFTRNGIHTSSSAWARAAGYEAGHRAGR